MSAIEHPPHYAFSRLEVIEVAELLPFPLGNAIKYLARAGKKGAEAEDVEKAAWYLRRFLKHPQPVSCKLPYSTDYVLDCWRLQPDYAKAVRCILEAVNLPYERVKLLERALSLLHTTK